MAVGDGSGSCFRFPRNSYPIPYHMHIYISVRIRVDIASYALAFIHAVAALVGTTVCVINPVSVGVVSDRPRPARHRFPHSGPAAIPHSCELRLALSYAGEIFMVTVNSFRGKLAGNSGTDGTFRVFRVLRNCNECKLAGIWCGLLGAAPFSRGERTQHLHLQCCDKFRRSKRSPRVRALPQSS